MSQKLILSIKADDSCMPRLRKVMKGFADALAAYPGAMQVHLQDDAGEVYLDFDWRNEGCERDA